jgi:4-diphosphocytidyl-2-C-methyl-D-erythritol kinase
MNNLNVKAYAKINLFLEIVGKRPDGYHNLQTIMQQIDLYDKISFQSINEDKIDLKCNKANLSADENNIVYKAVKAIKTEFNIKKGIKIVLTKSIPMGAGLGGGSSDCAQTIKALVKLWNIKTENKKLIEIASKLGADVPFFLGSPIALCEGIGEIVTPLKNIGKFPIILINPGFEISTANVFKRVKLSLTKKSGIHKICTSILDEKLDKNSISKVLFNRLEDFVFPYHGELLRIKTLLQNLGCASLMSGSGSTVFGIAQSFKHLDYVASKLQNSPWQITLTTSIKS